MGCCLTNITQEEVGHECIEENLKALDKGECRYKLLLLGAGECGKSTLLSHMKQIHGTPFTEDELLQYKPHILKVFLNYNYNYLLTTPFFFQMFSFLAAPFEMSSPFFLKKKRKKKEKKEKKEKKKQNKTKQKKNVIEAMRTLAINSEVLANKGEDTRVSPKNEELRKKLSTMNDESTFGLKEYEQFEQLWKEEGIQKTLEFRHRYQLIDTAEYLFENMKRFAQSDYVPTFWDMLHSRKRSTGVHNEQFILQSSKANRGSKSFSEILELYDVGGQRNERSKWINFFDHCHAIAFVAALSEYNQTLYEDNSQNRMQESLALFQNMINLDDFKNSHTILFLNKSGNFFFFFFFPSFSSPPSPFFFIFNPQSFLLSFFCRDTYIARTTNFFAFLIKGVAFFFPPRCFLLDLFRQKIKKFRIADYFSDFKGKEMDFDDGVEFIKQKFNSLRRDQDKLLYVHITCATDPTNITTLFHSMRSIVVSDNLSHSGFM
ncbi:hypothetical protein RFI_27163 [Reticulomyxa filosa]|uniref:Uncharacterized protein n=1 Tax=Reticulomyxa filosa TaxID=46433 RepID=X6M8H0_RETFI|nr:hypothetical protein RFI_27163 [Reticulomyxa filosa]|eukprot:ETO10214.1 hypothetical protein RFI_27163 [Reticulomyxa filosa]